MVTSSILSWFLNFNQLKRKAFSVSPYTVQKCGTQNKAQFQLVQSAVKEFQGDAAFCSDEHKITKQQKTNSTNSSAAHKLLA